MAERQGGNGNSELSSETIDEIEAIEQALRLPDAYRTLEAQIFCEYYATLPKISLDDICDSYVTYGNDDSLQLLMPVAKTPYGPLYKLAPTSSSDGELFIVGGTLVMNRNLDDMSEAGHRQIEFYTMRSLESSHAIIEFEENKNEFALFARELCGDGYLVLLHAFRFDDARCSVIAEANGNGEPGVLDYCNVVFTGQDTPTPIIISQKPVFTDGRIRKLLVRSRTEDGRIEYCDRF